MALFGLVKSRNSEAEASGGTTVPLTPAERRLGVPMGNELLRQLADEFDAEAKGGVVRLSPEDQSGIPELADPMLERAIDAAIADIEADGSGDRED